MATDEKKHQAKPKTKKLAKKRAPAKANRQTVRKTAPAEASGSELVAGKTPPVLVNAIRPEEKLQESAPVEQAVESIEMSLKAAVPAAVAVNCKLVDIAQVNMNAGLEFARDLAGARTPMEAMRLGMAYWRQNMGAFEAQAKELRALSADLVTTASEPIRNHIRRA